MYPTVTEKQSLQDIAVQNLTSYLADLLDKIKERALYLGLVDIVFAYAYDYRITEGEHNVGGANVACVGNACTCVWYMCTGGVSMDNL